MFMFGLARQSTVRQLDERLSTAEAALRRLEIEWINTYDKLRAAMLRIVKRQERDVVPQSDEPETEAAAGGNGLSVRQMEVQRQVMMRRNRAPREV